MSFQRSQTAELERAREQAERIRAVNETHTVRGRFIEYSVWAAIAVVAVYGLAHASRTALVIVGGVGLGLVALATCICIYAQNNSRF